LTGVGTIAGQSAPGLGPLTTILPVTGGTVSSKEAVGSSVISTSFGPSGPLGLFGVYEIATSRVATYQVEGSKPPQKICGSYTLGGATFNGSLNSGPFPAFDGHYYFGGSSALFELGKINSPAATCDLTLVASSTREIVRALKLSPSTFLVEVAVSATNIDNSGVK